VYGCEHTGYKAVHGPCTLYTGVFTFKAHEHHTFYGPCTWTVYTAVFTVRTRRCTRAVNTPVYRVHSRTRSCTGYTTVHTVVYPVHGHACGPCIQPSTAMYRLCTRRARPCTWSVHDPKTAVYTAVFTAVYTVVHGVYGPCTPRHNAYQASQKLTTEICWTAIARIQ